MFRSTLPAVVLSLALATSAHAMPGDPPVVPLAPADGAQVPANAGGIGVSFQCPDYRIAVFGPVTQRGDYGDYGVRFSDSADLGTDGRLATNPYGNDAGASLAPDRTCTAKLDTFDTAASPEIAGGRVYWQAYRPCTGCTPQYETGGVRSFVVRPSVSGTLRAPKRVYGGYPALFTVESAARMSGADVVLQRRAGGRWRTVVRRPFQLDRTELVATLPAGRQTLRALVVTGTTRFVVATRTLAVRRPGRRSTSSARRRPLHGQRHARVHGGRRREAAALLQRVRQRVLRRADAGATTGPRSPSHGSAPPASRPTARSPATCRPRGRARPPSRSPAGSATAASRARCRSRTRPAPASAGSPRAGSSVDRERQLRWVGRLRSRLGGAFLTNRGVAEIEW